MGYELHGLIVALARALGLLSTGSATLLWSGALLALAVGLMLFQIARGLTAVVTVPRGVLWLLGAWCVAASALLVLLSAVGGLSGHGALALGREGPWLDASALLGLGAVVGLSRDGGRWLVRHVPALEVTCLDATVRGPAQLRSCGHQRRFRSLPQAAGWSDRGPPRRAMTP